MRLQKSIEIAAPPEEIWPFLTQPEKIMRWFTLLRKFEYTSKKQGGIGATFYYEEKSFPGVLKLNYAVTEWVENKRIVFILTSGGMKKDDQVWNMEPCKTGSTFTMVDEFETVGGLPGKIIDKFLAGMIGPRLTKIQRNLKEIFSGGHGC